MSSITKETFKAGEFIFFEGDIESHFYIIESGEVSIFMKDRHGQKIDLSKLCSGDTFGEFALISKNPRTASAQALTDVKVMKISEEGFQMMLNDLPIWAASMLKSFTQRLRQTNTTIKQLKEKKLD